ncbi:MAG: LCP family protein [Thermomicrobiaceae bacterium]|nr:LCP family protein [Thermomicrobiaceae bacterium]
MPDWDKKERVNILLLGVDSSPERLAAGEPPLSDTMIIVTIDPQTKQVGMLSIPRDLKVTIPGVGETKINAAYSIGSQSAVTGPGLVRATIEANFHIPIHYYAEVNFDGFQKIVDTLGGVTIDVPAPIKDDEYPGEHFNYTRVYFHTGLQHMDGKTALRYARTRHDDNDFARGNRQQQVLMALRQQGINRNLITKAPELVDTLGDTVRTDLKPEQVLALAKLGTQIKGEDIHTFNLQSAVTEDYRPGQPYYLIPDWAKIHQILSQMMPNAAPAGAAAPTATNTPSDNPNLRAAVLVENATHVNRLAAHSAAKLQDAGFSNVSTAQSPNTGGEPTSRIVDYTGNPATARLIAEVLGLTASAIQEGQGAEPHGYDIVVTLGDDAPVDSGQ